MFNWILRKLESKGRKYVMLNARGYVIVEKYVLFGNRETLEAKRSRSLSLHHFIYLGADEFPHNHVGDFYSFVLNGGYWEHRNAEVRYNKRFSLIRMKNYEFHDIRSVLPNTWTLFYIGTAKNVILVKRGADFKRHKDVWHKVTPELHDRLLRVRLKKIKH